MLPRAGKMGWCAGALLCLMALPWFGAGCSGGGDGGPSVITVEGNDVPPWSRSEPADSREVAIAKCLASQGAVLYGASWCTYTQKQIASFKDGYQYLNYVECTQQAAVCDRNGITSYPTWVVGSRRLTGYRAPTEIGSAAGCSW